MCSVFFFMPIGSASHNWCWNPTNSSWDSNRHRCRFHFSFVNSFSFGFFYINTSILQFTWKNIQCCRLSMDEKKSTVWIGKPFSFGWKTFKCFSKMGMRVAYSWKCHSKMQSVTWMTVSMAFKLFWDIRSHNIAADREKSVGKIASIKHFVKQLVYASVLNGISRSDLIFVMRWQKPKHRVEKGSVYLHRKQYKWLNFSHLHINTEALKYIKNNQILWLFAPCWWRLWKQSHGVHEI